MKDPIAIREIPQTHKEDMPLVQDLVQAAYVVMLGWEVGFKYDLDKIRAKLNPRKISIPGYVHLAKLLHQHICESLFELTNDDYEVGAQKLNVFLECDIYLINTFGEAPQIDEESLDFSYESLSTLTTDELQNLRDAIDRIQILLSSRILYQDFDAAFRVLTYVPPKNFLNSESNFDISKLNTSRGWKLLAMYKSTTDSSCFTNEKSQNDLILYVYKWMITVNDRIFTVLKPSHKRDDDSRYLSNFQIPSSHFETSITELLITRFMVIWTMYQTHHHILINGELDKLYHLSMEDKQYDFLFSKFDFLDSHFKIRKVFLDFLLGNTFDFKENGLLESTREIRVFEKLSLVVNPTIASQLFSAPENLDIGEKTFWSAKVRKIGPESDLETGHRQKCKQYYRLTNLEWMRHKAKHITREGVYQVNPKILYSPGAKFCFPNGRLFDVAFLPFKKKGTFACDDDRKVYIEAVEFMFKESYETMCRICSLSD